MFSILDTGVGIQRCVALTLLDCIQDTSQLKGIAQCQLERVSKVYVILIETWYLEVIEYKRLCIVNIQFGQTIN